MNSIVTIYCQIVYMQFLVIMYMAEKKQNEIDEQVEAENAEVSCSSCPFDIMSQKILGLFRRK